MFKCEICQKLFNNQTNLTRHMYLHGDTEFKCEICGKTYKQKQELTTHMKSHMTREVNELKIDEAKAKSTQGYHIVSLRQESL